MCYFNLLNEQIDDVSVEELQPPAPVTSQERSQIEISVPKTGSFAPTSRLQRFKPFMIETAINVAAIALTVLVAVIATAYNVPPETVALGVATLLLLPSGLAMIATQAIKNLLGIA